MFTKITFDIFKLMNKNISSISCLGNFRFKKKYSIHVLRIAFQTFIVCLFDYNFCCIVFNKLFILFFSGWGVGDALVYTQLVS